MRQHTARVSTQWSALLDALGELVAHDDEADDVNGDKHADGEFADVERAPRKQWLGRCDPGAHDRATPGATGNGAGCVVAWHSGFRLLGDTGCIRSRDAPNRRAA